MSTVGKGASKRLFPICSEVSLRSLLRESGRDPERAFHWRLRETRLVQHPSSEGMEPATIRGRQGGTDEVREQGGTDEGFHWSFRKTRLVQRPSSDGMVPAAARHR